MLPVLSQPTVQLPMPLTQAMKSGGFTGFLRQSSGSGMPPLSAASTLATGSDRADVRPPLRDSAFVSMLADGVNAVNQAQHHADDQVHELLTGGDVTQAEVLTSVQKADMAFRLLVQVRNKLMSAYEELNSIRV